MEALGIDGKFLLGQIVNFSLLLIILRVFLYKPVVKMLEDRRKTIAESLDNAEQIKKNLDSSEQKTLEALDKAQKEARLILEEATKISIEQKNKIIADSQAQAERILDSSKAEAKKMKDDIVSDAKKELSELVMVALDKIVANEIDTETKNKLAKKSIENI